MPARMQKNKFTSLAVLAAAWCVCACGGSDGSDTHASSASASKTNDALKRAQTAAVSGSRITVSTSASLLEHVGTQMVVRADDLEIGRVEVRSTQPHAYTFTSSAPLLDHARVDIVFINGACDRGQDRNPFVESVSVDGKNLLLADPGVVHDRGEIAGNDGAGTFRQRCVTSHFALDDLPVFPD